MDFMGILKWVLISVHVVATIVLIFVILLQESKTAGAGQAITGSDTETFFGKGKGNTYDAIMRRWTTACAIIFLITSVSLTLLY